MERRLKEESDRTAHYLSINTLPALHATQVDVLLASHLQDILQMPGSGLVAMVDHDRIPDLSRMYALFCLVADSHGEHGKTALRLALRKDIEDRGKAVNEAAMAEPEAGPSNSGQQEDGDDTKGKGKAKAPTASGALSSALRWVQDVLDLKDKFDLILNKAFASDMLVQMSINEVGHIDRMEIDQSRRSNLSSTPIRERQNSCRFTLMNI